jgi:molybdopterin converting factor small subunit
MRSVLLALILLPLLGGCVARTLVNVATAPVKVVSKTVDLATTSQAESDRNRGRELRKLEERYGKLEREYSKEDRRCGAGREQSCAKRDAILAEMDEIRPQLPVRAD